MILLCILILFIMADILFVALLESLFAKNFWSLPIIYIFLFIAKECYVFLFEDIDVTIICYAF